MINRLHFKIALSALFVVSGLTLGTDLGAKEHLLNKREAAYSAFNAGNYEAAYRIFSTLAKEGDPDAQFQLGVLLEQGLGVGQDQSAAAKWYQMAVEAGHRAAMINLAALLYDGRGVRQDYRRSAELYRQAAQQGDLSALTTLGSMYEQGKGVGQDVERAFQLYERAAKSGYPYAQTALAGLYWSGRGVAPNRTIALAWWLVASELGDRFASENFEQLKDAVTEEDLRAARHLARTYRKEISKK